ncbi:MAG TPA: prohibitin family protein [Stenomitos sp.]
MQMQVPKIPLKLILALALFSGLVLIIRSFIYVTPAGNATVIFNTFTGLQRNRILKPGATLLNPFTDRPISYNLRTQIWHFSNEKAIHQAGNVIAVNSKDGQAFSLDVYIALRPTQETLDSLHGEVGENYMNIVVVPVARSKIRDISAEFESKDFYVRESRKIIEQKATALINQEMPTTNYLGKSVYLIKVEGVFLGTPYFPEGLKNSIEQKQVASISAQTAAVKAEIQSKETEKVLILAKANQKAIELKGKAAAANASLSELLLFEKLEDRIEQAKSKNLSLPIKVIQVPGSSTVFLNVDPKQASILQQSPNP